MVTSVAASLWRSRYSISRARSDVFAVTRIAPIFASANCNTTHSGTFVAHNTTRRPRLVALGRLLAATPRGAALINRIKADPALAGTEIRVLAHDSDYSRVLPRPGGGAAAPSMPAPAPPAGGSQPAATALKDAPATSAATLEPPPLDFGTRYAPRFRVTGKLEMLIDGNPAALVDLSITGAQVVSPTILKPNQRVRLTLSDDTAAIRLNAAIAWAQFEIPAGAPPQYRAGI